MRSFFLLVDANFECLISSGFAFIKSSTSSDVSCSIYMHALTYAGYRRLRACFTHVSEANGNSIPPYWCQIRIDPPAFCFYAFVIVLQIMSLLLSFVQFDPLTTSVVSCSLFMHTANRAKNRRLRVFACFRCNL